MERELQLKIKKHGLWYLAELGSNRNSTIYS